MARGEVVLFFYKWLTRPVGKHPKTHPFHPRFLCLEYNSECFLFGFVFIHMNSLVSNLSLSSGRAIGWLDIFINSVSYYIHINMFVFYHLSHHVYLKLSLQSTLFRQLLSLICLTPYCISFSYVEICISTLVRARKVLSAFQFVCSKCYKYVFFFHPPGLWQSFWSSQGKQEQWTELGFIIL